MKWNSYGMKITQEVLNKLQSFIPIKNPKGQNKGFRLKENGENTGIFYESPRQIGNVMEPQLLNALQGQNDDGSNTRLNQNNINESDDRYENQNEEEANVNMGEDVNQQNERDNNLNEGDFHAMDIAINN